MCGHMDLFSLVTGRPAPVGKSFVRKSFIVLRVDEFIASSCSVRADTWVQHVVAIKVVV